ncbi:PepSY domain-containing protein [Pseudomonas nunensis]|uniref:PepSY domain-containing protein n=1 Tax=Pseudomonas nunensis TaxID=2961896 RepID=UPI0006B59DD6|nr:PepSY domain-containing protein [Pseudomonas nunensis]KOY00279.1 hypothetical protein AM274_21590 [Pseudomonas nunensis]
MNYIHTVVALSLVLGSSVVMASAECPVYPKSEWMKETDARAKLEAEGYKIKVFKVSNNCYELYGHNKAGQKVEIYYDAKTLAVVKEDD